MQPYLPIQGECYVIVDVSYQRIWRFWHQRFGILTSSGKTGDSYLGCRMGLAYVRTIWDCYQRQVVSASDLTGVPVHGHGSRRIHGSLCSLRIVPGSWSLEWAIRGSVPMGRDTDIWFCPLPLTSTDRTKMRPCLSLLSHFRSFGNTRVTTFYVVQSGSYPLALLLGRELGTQCVGGRKWLLAVAGTLLFALLIGSYAWGQRGDGTLPGKYPL